jgi:hypothetical protein
MLNLPVFQEQLMNILLQLLETIGHQSVHDFLTDSDLGEDWRDEVEEYLTDVAQQVISEPAFTEVLTEMLSSTET